MTSDDLIGAILNTRHRVVCDTGDFDVKLLVYIGREDFAEVMKSITGLVQAEAMEFHAKRTVAGYPVYLVNEPRHFKIVIEA
jgi:hypothetical protein